MKNTKGSYAARQWLVNYRYDPTDLPFVGSLYDFYVYRKICITCTDEEVYKLNNFVTKHGMRNGIHMGINEIKQKLITENWNKKTQVNELCGDSALSQTKREIENQKLQAQQEELKYEENLSIDQLTTRNQPLKGGNIYTIPTNTLTSQKIIDSNVYRSIVKYTIYDKVHGCWSAKITAPYTYPQIIRRNNLEDIKAAARNAAINIYPVSVQKQQEVEDIKRAQANKTYAQRRKMEQDAYKQLQRVREALGQDNNNLNAPDIF